MHRTKIKCRLETPDGNWAKKGEKYVLADKLAETGDPVAAFAAYEHARSGPAADVVRTNRSHPPDIINIRVEELTGDRPFDNLDDIISQDELRALSESYKRIAGFALGPDRR